jgi:hypothetical protein
MRQRLAFLRLASIVVLLLRTFAIVSLAEHPGCW